MTAINQLSDAGTLSGSDLVPVWSQQNGDARKTSLSNMSDFVQSQISTSAYIPQYYTTTATGQTVQVTDGSDSIWLLLTPLAGYAATTISLPYKALAIDGQEVSVNCTQAVTTLTVSGNGASVVGAPTTLAANAFFKLRYSLVNGAWYRVG